MPSGGGWLRPFVGPLLEVDVEPERASSERRSEHGVRDAEKAELLAGGVAGRFVEVGPQVDGAESPENDGGCGRPEQSWAAHGSEPDAEQQQEDADEGAHEQGEPHVGLTGFILRK